MSTVRLRRLKADYANLKEYVRLHPRLRLIQTEGDPPERYQIEYRVRSLRMMDGELKPVQSHIVEVALTQTYPRTPPQCRMLSPVFHPNIAPHAICVGDHWGAGESLQSIVARIGEMLAYQSYNVKSPLNGEAARWVEGNKDKIPLDRVSMLVEEASATNSVGAPVASPSTPARLAPPVGNPASLSSSGVLPPSAVQSVRLPPQTGAPTNHTASPSAEVPAAPAVQVSCTNCGAGYKLNAEFLGRKVRCRKCMQVFVAASALA